MTSIDTRVQIIEVTLNNLGPLDALLFGMLITIVPATFHHLHTNDQVVLSIGVHNVPDVQSGMCHAV